MSIKCNKVFVLPEPDGPIINVLNGKNYQKDYQKEYRKNITNEQKQKYKNNQKQYRENMTDEQK